MSDPFVADSSIGIAWATPTQGNSETDHLLDDVALGRSVVVPSLWFLEIANTLLKLERTRRIQQGIDEKRSRSWRSCRRKWTTLQQPMHFPPYLMSPRNTAFLFTTQPFWSWLYAEEYR